jgi:hypothetical protein
MVWRYESAGLPVRCREERFIVLASTSGRNSWRNKKHLYRYNERQLCLEFTTRLSSYYADAKLPKNTIHAAKSDNAKQQRQMLCLLFLCRLRHR